MSISESREKLLNLPGQEDLHALVRAWDQVNDNITASAVGKPLVLPNMLWLTRSGVGRSTTLKLLSEYLADTRLIDFYGDVKFFEFLLEYCPPSDAPTELGRLAGAVSNAAGFRSEFRGLLSIDISPWKGCYEERNFLRVLEYLSSMDRYVCIIFCVENFDDAEVAMAERVLKAYFRIKRIRMAYPSVEAFYNHSVCYLKDYGFTFAEGAKSLLCGSIEQLRDAAYFDGYKTINRMCQDIAFDLCTMPDIHASEVSAERLAAYGRDSDFVKKLCERTKIRQLGFVGETHES